MEIQTRIPNLFLTDEELKGFNKLFDQDVRMEVEQGFYLTIIPQKVIVKKNPRVVTR